MVIIYTVSDKRSIYFTVGIVFRKDSLAEVIQENAQGLWLINYGLFKPWVDTFQVDHQCCGWNNVFDYCTESAFANIAYLYVRQGELDSMMDDMTNVICDLQPTYCDAIGMTVEDSYNSYYEYSDDYSEYGENLKQECSDDRSSTKCACYQINYSGADPLYQQMDCYFSERLNQSITIKEVCPSSVCHLYGCEYEFKTFINDQFQYFTILLFFMIIFYLTGVVTLLFINITVHKETFVRDEKILLTTTAVSPCIDS